MNKFIFVTFWLCFPLVVLCFVELWWWLVVAKPGMNQVTCKYNRACMGDSSSEVELIALLRLKWNLLSLFPPLARLRAPGSS